MKLLEEIIGFVVLTGPLFVIVVWLPVSIWAAVKLSKRFRGSKTRIPVGLLVLFLVFCLPFADGIAGRLYFSYLCATEAGVKVHETVELPAQYWDVEGQPKFFSEYGYLDRDFAARNISLDRASARRYSAVLGIDKDASRILEKADQVLLAEVTTFRFWGGWVRRNFSGNNTASSCSFIRDPEFNRELYSKIFVPAHSKE